MIWLFCYLWFIAIDHPPFLWKCFCVCVCVLITFNLPKKKKLLQKYHKARHQKGRRNCWYFPSLTKTSFPSGLKLRPTFRRRKLGSRGLDLGREGRTFAPDLSGLILLMWEVIMDGKKGKDAVPRRCLGKMDVCVCGIHDFWACLKTWWLLHTNCFQTWTGESIEAPKADHVLVPKYGLWNRPSRSSSIELKHGLQTSAVEQRAESSRNSGSCAA